MSYKSDLLEAIRQSKQQQKERYAKIGTAVQKAMIRKIVSEIDNMSDDVVRKQKEIIKRDFDKSVLAFYDSYNPMYYKHRRESLYKILVEDNLHNILLGSARLTRDFSPSSDGENTFTVSWGLYAPSEDSALLDKEAIFDRSGNSSYSDGMSMYKKVFIEGWHGGSEFDSKKHKHPNPGVPWYRSKRSRFKRWSHHQAVQTESAYKKFDIKINSNIDDGGELIEWIRIEAQKRTDYAMDNFIKNDLNNIVDNIL